MAKRVPVNSELSEEPLAKAIVGLLFIGIMRLSAQNWPPLSTFHTCGNLSSRDSPNCNSRLIECQGQNHGQVGGRLYVKAFAAPVHTNVTLAFLAKHMVAFE